MKKLATTTVIIILGFILIPKTVFAWDDCPKGLVNDPYPGECPRYVDTDDDGICDHSQPAPEDREAVDEVEPTASARPAKDSDSRQKLFLAFGTVFAPLLGILAYVGYRKRKTN